MIRSLVVLACIVYTGASIGHIGQRVWEIHVEEKDVELSLRECATGWWHWLPQIRDEAPAYAKELVGD